MAALHDSNILTFPEFSALKEAFEKVEAFAAGGTVTVSYPCSTG